MPENANAARVSRGAAENLSEVCAAKHNTEDNHRPAENQVVAVVRIVGAVLENYATRQLAIRRYGRAT